MNCVYFIDLVNLPLLQISEHQHNDRANKVLFYSNTCPLRGTHPLVDFRAKNHATKIQWY